MDITFKRGDTFKLFCVYKVDGVPAQLPPTIRSQVRSTNGSLISELELLIVDATVGQYYLICTDTSEWPLALLHQDIQYTSASGEVASTDTFTIQVVKDITHD